MNIVIYTIDTAALFIFTGCQFTLNVGQKNRKIFAAARNLYMEMMARIDDDIDEGIEEDEIHDENLNL